MVSVLALIEPDCVTAADEATVQHRGIHADIHSVMLGGRAQDRPNP